MTEHERQIAPSGWLGDNVVVYRPGVAGLNWKTMLDIIKTNKEQCFKKPLKDV